MEAHEQKLLTLFRDQIAEAKRRGYEAAREKGENAQQDLETLEKKLDTAQTALNCAKEDNAALQQEIGALKLIANQMDQLKAAHKKELDEYKIRTEAAEKISLALLNNKGAKS